MKRLKTKGIAVIATVAVVAVLAAGSYLLRGREPAASPAPGRTRPLPDLAEGDPGGCEPGALRLLQPEPLLVLRGRVSPYLTAVQRRGP